MKKIMFGIIIIILVVVAGVLLIMFKGPNLKDFAYLSEPVISQKADRNMLVVEAPGDPAAVAGPALKLLYTTYYTLKGVPKNFAELAPCSRWPVSEDTPRNQWVGLFALPVPDSLTELPPAKTEGNLKIYLAKWEYGTVAEILHTGSYENEQPTVKKLTDYITQKGYKIIGDHEEEYLKGPGLLGKGDPEKYLTIIRYRVALKEAPQKQN